MIIAEYKQLIEKKTGEPFPQDAYTQLILTRDAVFRSWNTARAVTYRRIHKIPDDLGILALRSTFRRWSSEISVNALEPGSGSPAIPRPAPRSSTGNS